MSQFNSLRFLDIFKGLFFKMGIDYNVMRSILKVKLMMDRRRIPSILNESKIDEEKNYFLRSLGIYALYGLILIPFLLFGDHAFIQMSLIFGVLFFILITTMIADFSSTMLDINDRHILHTKPVSNRTITAAKTIHMVIYLLMIIVALTTIPIVFMLINRGILFVMLFIVEMIALSVFLIVFTALIYFLILRFLDGERLKDVINYVQIILSVAIFVGFQVLVRLFDFSSFEFIYEYSWWHLLIPPLWFAAPFELVLSGNTSWSINLLSLLSIGIPVIALVIYIKMMPAFERYLEKMREVSTDKKKRVIWDDFCSKLLCRTKKERTFFRFSSIMISRERDFRLKVYPGLGIAMFLPFLILFNEYRASSFEELRNSNYFMSIYLCGLVLVTSIQMLKYSNNYKGAWIFTMSPHAEKRLFSAAIKTVLLKLYLPVFLLVSFAYIWIFSIEILPDLMAVFLGHIISALIIFKAIHDTKYPFTVPFNTVQEGNSFKMFFLTLTPGLFFVVHLIFQSFTLGIYIYLVILLCTVVIYWNRLFRISLPVA
ncbi:hypothetical protein ACFOZY_01560 [Chungangia koreensis]|uniref:ABC-2 type transport system permease protein n=1 Tax=Chungangia koreensis TaxID=752657 RepID=A0ABV8X4X4_9LACT